MAYIKKMLKGFVQDMAIANNGHMQKKYCFVLGAGASVESGIKTGQELVRDWDADLMEHLSPEEYAEWKKTWE